MAKYFMMVLVILITAGCMSDQSVRQGPPPPKSTEYDLYLDTLNGKLVRQGENCINQTELSPYADCMVRLLDDLLDVRVPSDCDKCRRISNELSCMRLDMVNLKTAYMVDDEYMMQALVDEVDGHTKTIKLIEGY